jgi:hypothetical protein
MKKISVQDAITMLLHEKAPLKQHVFDVTLHTFREFKNILKDLANQYNEKLTGVDKRINLEFTERSEFVAQLKVASDMLVFYMHTNAFQFDRSHKVWEQDYVKNDMRNSYVCQIYVFNFLNDSFRYNRMDDAGYLVARIFINREGHFFVEGKRQQNMGLEQYPTSVINSDNIQKIIEIAMLYSLEFDLLVPPYDDVKIISLAQINEEIINSGMRTGKRLGFQYNSDDIK